MHLSDTAALKDVRSLLRNQLDWQLVADLAAYLYLFTTHAEKM
jgi:hypothetical protein